MAFSVNTNIASLQAQNYLRTSSDFQSKTINRVTSGLRIVSSGDDAAGLAIANGFRSDQAVLSQGIRNANDGLSTLQTIDGGMNNISNLLDRARTLATQSASGTFIGDRNVLNSEFQSVMIEIDRQAQSIGLNQNGTFAKSLSVFIGGGKGLTSSSVISNGSVSVDLSASTVDARSLGLNSARAVASGYNLGSNSATSISKILANTQNTATEQTAGHTAFTFRGAGFSDSSAITIDVNIGGVTDTESLVAAVNAAISSAANPTVPTTASAAFKAAGVTASIVTDADGRQTLAFNAPNAAFQVAGYDRVSNALLGNFADAATALGAAAYSVTGPTVPTPSAATNAGATITFAGNSDAGANGTITLATTVDMTAQEFVDAFNASAAGTVTSFVYKASLDTAGKVVIASTNGSAFTVAGDATNGDIFVGAGPTASTFNVNSALEAGGVQSSQQFAADGKAFSYTTLATGTTDQQTVSFAGTHADGTQYSWSTTLDATAASITIDGAVSALNAALQASNDSSLMKIVAVKDVDSTAGGTTLGIRFMSSDEFTVTLGAGTGGRGLWDGSAGAVAQGSVLASAENAGSGLADISNQTTAQAAVSALSDAVTALGNAQAVVGKGQNTFNYAVSLAQSQVTNLAAAESRIRDADLAAEAANLSKAQILMQAGTAALAQANSAPQTILTLLRG